MEDPHQDVEPQLMEMERPELTDARLEAFLTSEGHTHAIIDAVAGAGKSRALKTALTILRDRAHEPRVLMLAFNNKNVEDFKEIITELRLTNTVPMSFHGFGQRCLPVAPRRRVEDYKFGLFKGGVGHLPASWKIARAARDLASIAQNTASGITNEELKALMLAEGFGSDLNDDQRDRAVEQVHNHLSGLLRDATTPLARIDYDDMMWLPHIAQLPVPVDGYEWIFLDESQDFNPVQLLMLARLMAAHPTARVLAAGDPNQSIYSFRGARESMTELRALLAERGGHVEFSLPVCQRCPTSHLELASLVVPHIRPRPVAARGILSYTNIATAIGALRAGDFVLCRNTKALVSLACLLIRMGLPAQVVRELSLKQDLMAFFQAAKRTRGKTVWQQADEALRAVKRDLFARGETKSISLYEDLYETAKLLSTQQGTPDQAITFLNKVFVNGEGDGEMINCCTIHKSKGANLTRVWLLVGHGQTSNNPTLQHFGEEEQRLLYVAFTRSAAELHVVECDEEMLPVNWADIASAVTSNAPPPAGRPNPLNATVLPLEVWNVLHPAQPQ